MKKIISLVLAVFSTLLLATGATRSAEKLDPLTQPTNPRISNDFAAGPTMPCEISEPPFNTFA
jgi:hypothetical protein